MRRKKRTRTIVCETDGELYEITEEMIGSHQNPKPGFYFMRVVTGRLMRDVQRATAGGRS